MEKGFEYPRDFKGIFIPKEVWLDDKLSAIDKFILAEINSLDVEENGGCYASNEYLAEFCQCSVSKVSASISKLIKLRYVKIGKFDGRKRFLRVCLTKFSSLDDKKSESQSQKIEQRHIDSKINRNIEDNSMRVCSFSGEKEVSPSSERGTLSPTIIKAIDDAMTEEGETHVSSFREELKDIAKYFVNEYARTQGKPHKPLTRPAISNIVYNYMHQDEDEYGIMDDVWTLDQYIPLIDMYMQTNYREGIEKSMSHFMYGSIRRNLKAKLIE